MYLEKENERKTGEFRYSMTISNSPSSVANQNAEFALVHQLGDTKCNCYHAGFLGQVVQSPVKLAQDKLEF